MLERCTRPRVLLGITAAAGTLFATLTGMLLFTLLRAGHRTPLVLQRAEQYERTGLRAADLPPSWLDALVMVEDPSFFDHPGVDLRSPGAGWTTITQGLVKLSYPGPMRGLLGKPRQSILALALDRAMNKDLQMTLFLNTAYLGQVEGRPIHGFPEAARVYYGLALADLTPNQFLGLVAMLPAPSRLDPIDHAEANRDRVRRIRALLDGRCSPSGLRDVALNGCADG